MTVKWTEEKVLNAIQEARNAGYNAAQLKLTELVAAGPAWAVTNGDGSIAGTMLDVCGMANLKIKARGKFYLLAKKLSAGNRHSCGRHYYGGGRLNIFDSTMRQELSVNKAACKAQSEYLFTQYGIESHVESRID